MAVKRRVIWLDDEVWKVAGRDADTYAATRSGYIRSLIVGERIAPQAIGRTILTGEGGKLGRQLTQTERDAVLRRVNKG